MKRPDLLILIAVIWVCKTFTDNPISSVELGEVYKSQNGLPTVPYIVRLQDSRELRGNLPFRYMPRQGNWMGVEGIDWHLQYPDATKPKSEAKEKPVKTKVSPVSVKQIVTPQPS